MKKRKVKFILINIILPIVVGGIIYILFRQDTLIMFNWLHNLNLYDLILALRAALSKYIIFIPDWMLYSLPGALWLYSLMIFLGVIWFPLNRKLIFYIFSFGVLVGIGYEYCQYLDVIRGEFCFIDLTFNVLIIALSTLTILKYNKGLEYEIEY